MADARITMHICTANCEEHPRVDGVQAQNEAQRREIEQLLTQLAAADAERQEQVAAAYERGLLDAGLTAGES